MWRGTANVYDYDEFAIFAFNKQYINKNEWLCWFCMILMVFMVHIWCLLGRKDWTKKNNTHIHNSMLWIKISLVELLLLYVLLLYKCFRVFFGFFLLELLKNITKLFWIKNWYIWNEGKERDSETEMKMSFGSFRWNHAGILCSIVMHSLQRLTFICSLKSWRPCDLTQNN